MCIINSSHLLQNDCKSFNLIPSWLYILIGLPHKCWSHFPWLHCFLILNVHWTNLAEQVSLSNQWGRDTTRITRWPSDEKGEDEEVKEVKQEDEAWSANDQWLAIRRCSRRPAKNRPVMTNICSVHNYPFNTY